MSSSSRYKLNSFKFLFITMAVISSVFSISYAETLAEPAAQPAAEPPVETVSTTDAVKDTPPEASESPEPEYATVQYLDIDNERIIDALVEAIHKATVSSQTSGRVSNIYYDVNDYAKKGDILLRIRDKDQRATLKVAQADFHQTETEFKRINELFSKQLVARSLLDRAEADLKSATARLEQAQENLEYTVVRAPYSGILVKRHIEVGESARVGVPLFTGLSLEKLRVAVNLPQDIINVVRKNNQARVLPLNKTRSIDASSMVINPYADADNHTFLVRVNLPEGDHGLYPGMAVKVAFKIGSVRKLAIPLKAVTYRSEITAVYVIDEQQKLSFRQIRIGRQINDEMVEVLAGLEENEQVSMNPLTAVKKLKEQQQL